MRNDIKTGIGTDLSPRVLYDFSKYNSFLFQDTPTGIARVDVEYAQFFLENPQFFYAGRHDRYYIRTRFSIGQLRKVVRVVRGQWDRGSDAGIGAAVEAWLRGSAPGQRRILIQETSTQAEARKIAKLALNWPYQTVFSRIPKRAIYLNTSYANLTNPRSLDWLRRRPDIIPVFMIHDLLPIDRPELFWDDYKPIFSAQIGALLEHAQLVLVSSRTVARRVGEFARAQGRERLQVEAIPLPPASEFLIDRPEVLTLAERLREIPYFVMCGTIEPRKNHLFVLQLWEAMIASGSPVPKLIIIGARGWKNTAIVERLETSAPLQGHVLEVSNLSTTDMRQLIAGARASLAPSLDEGFGMPIVEALSLGTPVIASDIPIFREVAQGCATLLALDAPEQWRRAIEQHAFDHPVFLQEKKRASSFEPMTWQRYFRRLVEILTDVSANQSGNAPGQENIR